MTMTDLILSRFQHGKLIQHHVGASSCNKLKQTHFSGHLSNPSANVF